MTCLLFGTSVSKYFKRIDWLLIFYCAQWNQMASRVWEIFASRSTVKEINLTWGEGRGGTEICSESLALLTLNRLRLCLCASHLQVLSIHLLSTVLFKMSSIHQTDRKHNFKLYTTLVTVETLASDLHHSIRNFVCRLWNTQCFRIVRVQNVEVYPYKSYTYPCVMKKLVCKSTIKNNMCGFFSIDISLVTSCQTE